MEFRQYYRPTHVLAAQIIRIPRPLLDAVEVMDVNGRKDVLAYDGLFRDGVPVVGDWLLMWPSGRRSWLSNAAFQNPTDPWEPARGPILS